MHVNRRLATAITVASPPPNHTIPVVLLLASPTSGMLTAIGPFTTTDQATTWLNYTGSPGGDIIATAFPLHTPTIRPPWTSPGGHRDRCGATPGPGGR